jgi:hypothetical protein
MTGGCKSPHLAAVAQVGRFDSLPRVSNERLRRSLGPRATCGVTAVVVSADLLAFRLDPQTARRDTTRAESRDRARARLAETSRAEISEWEVDGRFHRIPFNEASMSSRSAGSTFARDRIRCPARPRDAATGHMENESRAAMLSLAVRCTVEVTHPRHARRAEEHRDATPRAGTLASTVFVVKCIFAPRSRAPLRDDDDCWLRSE